MSSLRTVRKLSLSTTRLEASGPTQLLSSKLGGAIALAARILESSAVLEAMVAERFSNVAGFLTSVGSVFSESIGVRLSMFTFGDDR